MACIILLVYENTLYGQNIVFSENFSGFTTGTHATPSTADVSGNLDSKTQVPGWTGFKVYSAGGEVKLGTSDIAGWLETPLISFSGYTGDLVLKFDICRWPGDATIVQILLNGALIVNSVTPTDEFQTIEVPIPQDILSGKVKFEALSKRFFIDNVAIIFQNVTYSGEIMTEPGAIVIFPNPACDFVSISNTSLYEKMDIIDIYGRICFTRKISNAERIEVSMADLPAGIYFIRFSSGKYIEVRRIVKYK
jgi:hypothetical protein